MDSALVEAWGIFLSAYPWDWFVTLTFREPPGSFRAHRMFAQFAADIERAANVRIGWFRGDEYGPLGGRLHIHALMLNTAHLPRLAWMDEWKRRAGFARILPFDRTKGAAFYCSKYVTKELGDYDFSENIAAFKEARPTVQFPLYHAAPERRELIAAPKAPLSAPSRPVFRNVAEDPLIAGLDGNGGTEKPESPQFDLIPEDGEDR